MNDSNLHKSVLELAEESGFIAWVKGNHSDEANKWGQWIKDNPSINDKISEAARLVKAISFKEEADLDQKEDIIWSNIQNEIRVQKDPAAKVIPLRKYITIAAIAASIILPLFIFLGDNNQLIRATHGEKLSYNFPDQSSAQLNAGSSLEYNPKNWKKKREVVLKGEAFFEVEKGERFEVVTNNGSVVVLGTSFNVFSRGNRFEVSCLTGKVEVKTEQHSLVLNPGDAVQLDFEKKRLVEINDLDDNKVDWLEGEYHFENAKLAEVFDEMERQFNIEINVPKEVLNQLFTGSFVSQNIDTALYQVCWPMNLVSEKELNKIRIKKSTEK